MTRLFIEQGLVKHVAPITALTLGEREPRRNGRRDNPRAVFIEHVLPQARRGLRRVFRRVPQVHRRPLERTFPVDTSPGLDERPAAGERRIKLDGCRAVLIVEPGSRRLFNHSAELPRPLYGNHSAAPPNRISRTLSFSASMSVPLTFSTEPTGSIPRSPPSAKA